MEKDKTSEKYFWLFLGALLLLRLALSADLGFEVNSRAHDDGLYTTRAFHYLNGNGFGPYSSMVLFKLPGLSFWIAWVRMLGIPYLFASYLLFFGAGFFLVSALRKLKLPTALVAIVFIALVFNPVTFEWEWFRIKREPLAISLSILIFSSMLFILDAFDRKQYSPLSILLLSGAFSLEVLCREDEKILMGTMVVFNAILCLKLFWQRHEHDNRRLIQVLLTIFVPWLVLGTSQWGARRFVNKHYGLPILHELSEGGFPGLIAAMRSVTTTKQNRHVMIPNEALQRIKGAVPILVPVISKLPPPSRDSYSCERFGVCSEWTNGWLPFWIKDAAYTAGVTPNLTEAQSFFYKAAAEIRRCCQEGKLICHESGAGLLPPFQWRWFAAFLEEWRTTFSLMYQGGIRIQEKPPRYWDEIDYSRKLQFSTMTHHVDTLTSELKTEKQAWENYSPSLHASLRYWLRYPDIATDKQFGVEAGASGSEKHFLTVGKEENRVWQIPNSSIPILQNPLASWRPWSVKVYRFLDKWVLIGGITWFIVHFWYLLWARSCPSPIQWAGFIFFSSMLLRSVVMAYVSVYMGSLDARLFFSTYVLWVVFGIYFTYEALTKAWVNRQRWLRMISATIRRFAPSRRPIGALVVFATLAFAPNVSALDLEIAISEKSRQHIALLEYPAVFPILLDLNGITISNSGRIRIINRSAFELVRDSSVPFKKASLRFKERNGTVFRYESFVSWSISGIQLALDIELETRSIERGFIQVRILPSRWLKAFIPKDLEERINQLIAKKFNRNSQDKFIKYLTSIQTKSGGTVAYPLAMEAILLEHINSNFGKGPRACLEPGDASPTSARFFLFLICAVVLGMSLVSWIAIGTYRLAQTHKRSR
ncbi:MAG: hypothetical protein HY537_03995 [Deltaproteobacteria bacterium]|nr:hypothetical protein [Deltaproteobacteria bacterium]